MCNLLKYFQFQGIFPSYQISISHEIVVYIAQAVKQRATLSRIGVETASNSFHLGV
jgi:hypothetical protein